jgi:hypothetical protein
VKRWDLTSAPAKLEGAIKTLEAIRAEVMDQWDDDTSHRFQAKFLAPLLPKVKRALDAIDQLNELLEAAYRECEADS